MEIPGKRPTLIGNEITQATPKDPGRRAKMNVAAKQFFPGLRPAESSPVPSGLALDACREFIDRTGRIPEINLLVDRKHGVDRNTLGSGL